MSFVNLMQLVMQGHFPHPGESEAIYRQRLQNEEIQRKELRGSFESESYVGIDEATRHVACKEVEQFCGCYPSWVPAIYASQGLGKLHLGALVIYEPGDVPCIQLHNRWQNQQRWFGYKRESVLAHEIIHYLRHGLDDGKYEEFMAYQLESNAFRKNFGPLFAHPSSAMMCMLAITSITVGLWAYLIYLDWLQSDPSFHFIGTMGVIVLVLGLSTLGIIALNFMRNRLMWNRFCKKASTLISSPQKQWLFTLLLPSFTLERLSNLPVSQWSLEVSLWDDCPHRRFIQNLLHADAAGRAPV